ncbi:MAG: hypothetical protein QM658_01520 [Gordonia sp. (in: high G+C Gram-positive bacteria)]
MTFPQDSYGIVRRQAMIGRGYTDRQLESYVADGELIRLGYGCYAVGSALPDDERLRADEAYRLRCVGHATSGRAKDVVLSHQSAAAVHRLPLLDPDRERVHTVNLSAGRGSILRRRHIHPGPVPRAEVVDVEGVSATSLERTAVDVSCVAGFAGSLTTFDGTLRRGATREGLERELRGRRRVGSAMADRGLAFADGVAESAGESLSRAYMIDGGVPMPRLQVRYRLPSQVAFVDFDWDGKLVGEFDGMVKYGRLLKRGQSVLDVVLREKKRQDEIERLGPKVIRWTWADVLSGQMLEDVRYWIRRLGIAA